MKILIIGTLIVTLISATALAVDNVGIPAQLQQESAATVGELQQQSSEFNESGNPEQTPYVPFSNNGSYAGRYPYEGNYPYISDAYAYPMEQTVVIPVPGANTIHSGRDIDHSSYTQMLEPQS